MFPTIIPETFAGVLVPYAACFQARSYLTFQWLVLGWVQCLERRTLTAVALASGAVGARHISVFHRFFARARVESGRRGAGRLPASVAMAPRRPAGVSAGRRHAGAQGGQVCESRVDAPRPVALHRPQAVLQLRPRLGRARAVGAPADGPGPGVCPAAAGPAVHRGEAGGPHRCALAPDAGAAPPGGRRRPCRAGSADQAGVAAGAGRPRGRLGPDPAVLPGGRQRLCGADRPGAAPAQRGRGQPAARGCRAVGARPQAPPGAEGPAPASGRAAAHPPAGGRPLSTLARR